MQEKIFHGGNVLATIMATIGTYANDFWPLALGFIGWVLNLMIKWRKAEQEYRHREELHEIEKENRKNNDDE